MSVPLLALSCRTCHSLLVIVFSVLAWFASLNFQEYRLNLIHLQVPNPFLSPHPFPNPESYCQAIGSIALPVATLKEQRREV